MKRDECSPQEQWVLEKVEQGEIADLKENFGEAEDNRRLRAKFLEALLTNEIEDFKPNRQNIRIAHAVVDDPMDLKGAEIFPTVDLFSSLFKQDVTFQDTHFRRHLFLNLCEFYKKANFHRVRVELDFLCRYAIFHGQVDFGIADIGRQFAAEGAKFLEKEHDANFHSFQVRQSAFFDGAKFSGPVNFSGADVKGQFAAQGAGFLAKEKKVIFNSLKVGDSAFFEGAEFNGPVDLSLLRIGGSFYLTPFKKDSSSIFTIFRSNVNFSGSNIALEFRSQEARFLSNYQRVYFCGLRVGHSAFFHEAEFHGPVDFRAACILGDFLFEGAKFNGQGRNCQAVFNGIKVGICISFDNAIFRGPVDLRGGEIGGEFWVKRAHFKGEREKGHVKFNGLKVGTHAFFQGSVFHGKVDFDFLQTGGNLHIDTEYGQQETTFFDEVKFGGATIGGQFLGNRARFNKSAHFGGLRVEDKSIFNDPVFEGNVSWNYAFLKDLEITGGRPFDSLNLSYASIERELILAGLTLSNFEAWNVQSRGYANLYNLIIKESCSMQDSSFGVLNIVNVTWPPQQKIWLEGLTYKTISAGDKDEDWHKLLDWIEAARFNTQTFSQLETYFTRCGHRNRADQVFIAGKRRAANRLTCPKKWFTKVLWGGLAGYGRKPWQVLYVILPMVVLGAILFTPEFTTKFKESHDWVIQMHPLFIKFLLSLDQFLPGVDLGIGKEWSPSSANLFFPSFTCAYWYFLKIAGWITIPIALAAIYTRIK